MLPCPNFLSRPPGGNPPLMINLILIPGGAVPCRLYSACCFCCSSPHAVCAWRHAPGSMPPCCRCPPCAGRPWCCICFPCWGFCSSAILSSWRSGWPAGSTLGCVPGGGLSGGRCSAPAFCCLWAAAAFCGCCLLCSSPCLPSGMNLPPGALPPRWWRSALRCMWRIPST